MSRFCLTIVGVLFFILLTLPTGAYFVSEIGIGGGARPLGMGGSFVAIADDGNALFWNSAGLSELKISQVNMMHTNLFNTNIAVDIFSYQTLVGNGRGIGMGFEQVNYGELGANARTFTLGYGQNYNSSLFWGLAGKYHEFSSDSIDWGSTGNSLDLGIIYQVKPYLRLGVAGKNILSSLRWNINIIEKMARTVSIGVALEKEQDYYTFEIDAIKDPSLNDMITKFKFGFEKKLNELLTMRAGWTRSNLAEDGLGSFSGGLSYHYQNWQVDYAYIVGQGELRGTHLLSATLKFDSEYKQMLRRTVGGH